MTRPSIEKVIDKDFCIGCGACSAISPAFRLGETDTGFIRVIDKPRDTALLEKASKVCPFADAPNEDQLAAALFAPAANYDEGVGRYVDLYAGYSREFRSSAGSGGITRWLLSRLLNAGEIDFVVTIDRKLKDESGDLFTVAIHDTAQEFLEHTSTSAYFPISLSAALAMIAQRPGRFAVTALPCFARALRSLAVADPVFGARLAYVSGTICGGLKSRRYAEYLGYQMGVEPADLRRINFRGKELSRSANEKCVEVWSDRNDSDRPDAIARVQQLRGTDYGSGYFKPKACDYCDDVFAETADISFGDAWISPYKDSPEGTNVIVVRNAQVSAMLKAGVASGELVLDEITPEQARLTQLSGLRHRRQGLAIRLWLARLTGRWTPRKRVVANRGTWGFMASQITRIGIRWMTSLSILPPTSKLFPMALRPLVKIHGRLRKRAVQPQRAGVGAITTPPVR